MYLITNVLNNVSLVPFINKPDSLRDLTIFMISSIFPFQVINAVIPEPRNVLWIPEYTVDTATVNLNGIKTLLPDGLSIFFINGNNQPDRTTSDSCLFDNFILADGLFEKTLQIFETCLSVSNNLYEN